MDEKRTPMEAEVQELPPRRDSGCPGNFYGTAAKPRPRRSHTWFWICAGLSVIAVCTFSVVAALSHVRVENRDGSWRLAMKNTEMTQPQEDPIRDLEVPDENKLVTNQNKVTGGVRLPLSSGHGQALTPAEVYAKAAPSVVCVQVEGYYGTASYTGVVIRDDGYILSATEGLNNAAEITVSFFDGTELPARRVGEERTSGVCLLKVEAQELQTAGFCGDQELTVGQSVFCICNPYGRMLPNVFYQGILSASRSVAIGGTEFALLKTSLRFTEAGSGCPVLDAYGRVLGLTTPIGKRIVAGEDPCFAVSAADLANIVSAFDSAEADSLWLGLEVGEIPEEYQYLYGFPGRLWIEDVSVGSAAYGVLFQYDVITAVDGVDVSAYAELEQAISAHKPGEHVELTIFRSGKWYKISLPVLTR